jgi:transcriptional regulator with XRE-family HTH domain
LVILSTLFQEKISICHKVFLMTVSNSNIIAGGILMATFGQRLKRLREEKELSQQELAKLFSLSQSTIAYYELDKKQPSQKTLQRLAEFFGCTVDYILGRTDIRNPDQPDEDIVAFLRAAEDLTEDEKREVLAYIEFRKAQRRKKKDNE